MKTMKAEYGSALDRNNAAFDRFRADMAAMREDAAKRELRLERAMNGRDKWFYGLLISLLVGVVLLLVRQYLPPIPVP